MLISLNIFFVGNQLIGNKGATVNY